MTTGQSSVKNKEVEKNSKAVTQLSFIKKMIDKFKGKKKK
jgi:hypothetical protein